MLTELSVLIIHHGWEVIVPERALGILDSGEFETSAILTLDASLVEMPKAEKFLPNWSNGYFILGWYVPTKVGVGFHLKDITESGVVRRSRGGNQREWGEVLGGRGDSRGRIHRSVCKLEV